MLDSNEVWLRTIGRGGIAPEAARDVGGTMIGVYIQ